MKKKNFKKLCKQYKIPKDIKDIAKALIKAKAHFSIIISREVIGCNDYQSITLKLTKHGTVKLKCK